MRYIFLLITAIFFLGCKEKHPGFSEIEKGYYKKLIVLGDDDKSAILSSYLGIEVLLFPDSSERKATYLLCRPEELYRYFKGEKLLMEINSMKQGEIARFIVPGREAVELFSTDSATLSLLENAEYQVVMEKRFKDQDNICTFFMHKAQESMISEEDAIRLCQSTLNKEWEDFGDVSICFIEQTEGDSVKAGRDISIEYNTYWLDGTRKDSLTQMAMNFGKPGQLIPGLQYGLSLMKKGERALIYMPSTLAFGEEGSNTGIIPPRTPVYFDVKILDVKNK